MEGHGATSESPGQSLSCGCARSMPWSGGVSGFWGCDAVPKKQKQPKGFLFHLSSLVFLKEPELLFYHLLYLKYHKKKKKERKKSTQLHCREEDESVLESTGVPGAEPGLCWHLLGSRASLVATHRCVPRAFFAPQVPGEGTTAPRPARAVWLL